MAVNNQCESVLSSEAEIWDQLHTKRRKPMAPEWLYEHYSVDSSRELKLIICEQLGHHGSEGWQKIKTLIENHGVQHEFIRAAGLCHQKEAFRWLLSLMTDQQEHIDCGDLAEALACWGAVIPEQILIRCILHHSQKVQLSGVAMLNFRSYRLSAKELLNYCDMALQRNIDSINLEVIRILQRRDEDQISERLYKLCIEGSDATSLSALKALGCMNSPTSRQCLKRLTETLSERHKKELAVKQLSQQCVSMHQD